MLKKSYSRNVRATLNWEDLIDAIAVKELDKQLSNSHVGFSPETYSQDQQQQQHLGPW